MIEARPQVERTTLMSESPADLVSLQELLRGIGPAAIALSGGVDSMTLAMVAHRSLPGMIEMFHAVSPAVPVQATVRVRRYAEREKWTLHVIDAGEFDDPAYRRNPVDRCFYCKMNLYRAVCRRTSATVLSGTNCDDLGDYRPGLQAASDHGVRHPFVEVGLDKRHVRAIARCLGLDDLAELPAAPCLASRIETGLAIEPEVLQLVNEVELLIGERLTKLAREESGEVDDAGAGNDSDATGADRISREGPSVLSRTVRCRVREAGVVIELDQVSLASLEAETRDELREIIAGRFRTIGKECAVMFERYRTGSAFLTGSDGSEAFA